MKCLFCEEGNWSAVSLELTTSETPGARGLRQPQATKPVIMSSGRVGGHAAPADFDPNTADNHPGVEARWATLAMQHAETYMNLLKARDPKELRLTPYGAAPACPGQ